MIVNRSWLVVNSVYVALDCIDAYEAYGINATTVFMRGGHTLTLDISLEGFVQLIQETNRRA